MHGTLGVCYGTSPCTTSLLRRLELNEWRRWPEIGGTNQTLNDANELHLMTKLVRPAPSDSGKWLGDTKRRKNDEVKERESHQGPGVHCNHATSRPNVCTHLIRAESDREVYFASLEGPCMPFSSQKLSAVRSVLACACI